MEFIQTIKRTVLKNIEILQAASIYLGLNFILLKAKLDVTSTYFDGTLESNHTQLLTFNYLNNEQSRLFQFLIPETFHQFFGLHIIEGYILQRLIFIFLSLVLFHKFLRKWFSQAESYAMVFCFAAIMPLTFMNDLQESAPLLLVTFLLGLWAIRENNFLLLFLSMIIGAFNNETMIFIPLVYFFYNLDLKNVKTYGKTFIETLGVMLPGFLIQGTLRYITRHNGHLGGAWHWPDNWEGIISQIQNFNILHLYRANYLYIGLLFGVLWLFSLKAFSNGPKLLRRALFMIPFFIFGHLVTGITSEVRQMLPLAYIIFPLSFWYIFRSSSVD